MQIKKLKELLSKPPYNTMTDDELVVELNSPTVKVKGPVSKGRLIQWAGENQGFTTMEAAEKFTGSGDSNLDLAVQNIGKAALYMFSGGDVPEFDTGSSKNEQMLGLLVSVGLMSQSAADSLMEAGAVMMTPEAVAGVGGYVNYGDIAEARAL